MSCKKLTLILCISLSLLTQTVNAQGVYQESMLRIDSQIFSNSTVEKLEAYQGSTMLLSFFMPKCKWCKRQHSALKRMQESCPKLNTVMLGVQGSKQQLRRALKRKKNTFPAFIASPNIIKAVGSGSPVPMMLVFNKTGKLIFKTIGYTEENKLKTLLNQNSLNICPA